MAHRTRHVTQHGLTITLRMSLGNDKIYGLHCFSEQNRLQVLHTVCFTIDSNSKGETETVQIDR